MDIQTRAAYVWELCQGASRSIYGTTAPSERYAEATADLLYGTIAHESVMFQHTRQIGFSWPNDHGAWGICQCELGSVTDSIALLVKRRDIGKRVAQFVAGDRDATDDWLITTPPRIMLRWLAASDPLAVAFCRLHYLRVSAAIPYRLEDQDAYYKRYYNTSHGAARPGDFQKALRHAHDLIN